MKRLVITAAKRSFCFRSLHMAAYSSHLTLLGQVT